MSTNDERRKVARRLRKAIGLTEFAEVLGFDWTDDSDWVWNDVSNLVADLIEPEPERTCRMEYDMAHESYVCTACGEAFYLDAYMMPNPNGAPVYKLFRHCPRCGALILGVKVVDE